MAKTEFSLPFIKMQGLGNDFVVIDDLGPKPATTVPLTPEIAKKICDRRYGVGADQILWLRKPKSIGLDARMEILNADGSIAEMCGNGIRAVGVYLHQLKPAEKYEIETLAGIKTVFVNGNQVKVDMGLAQLGPGFETQGEKIEIQGETLRFFEVNTGNPHAVIFVENVDQYPVEKLGPLIENHSRFSKRTNVEFVQVVHSHAIKVRVWERGAGITLACGTGACASAVASLAIGCVKNEVDVELPGGHLKIQWNGPSEPIWMSGPADEVFRGTLKLSL